MTDRQLEFPAWGLYCGNLHPSWTSLKAEEQSLSIRVIEDRVYLRMRRKCSSLWTDELFEPGQQKPSDYQVLLTAGVWEPEKAQGDSLYVRDGSTKE